MKKFLYGINLILAVVMCFTMLFFPILRFDSDAIYDNHQEVIDAYVKSEIDAGNTKSQEELKEEAINDIIYQTLTVLQMYYSSDDVVYDEDNNEIESNNDYEAMMFDMYRIKEKGIKYTDLANSIKNQIDYDIKLNKAIKDATGKGDLKLFFANWANPIPMILVFLLVAFIFASAVIVIIRSIKGIFEHKHNKLIRISAFGVGISFVLLMLPVIFKSEIDFSTIDNANVFIKIFLMNVRGTSVCYYSGIGFLICLGLSIFAKFFRYSKKEK